MADGGLSTCAGRGGKFPEEISDEGAPQGISCGAGPDEGGAGQAGACTRRETIYCETALRDAAYMAIPPVCAPGVVPPKAHASVSKGCCIATPWHLSHNYG
ncbi:hypothetical protein ARTHROSP310_22990 [Arthrobacter sp. AD-310]